MQAPQPVFVDNTLKFVELASFIIKRACDELGVRRQMEKKAADLRGSLLDYLIKTGAVRPEQRAEAEAMLGSHAETMMLLKNATEELALAQAKKAGSDLGDGVDDPQTHQQKQAFDSVNDPFVGRPTSQRKASDLAILRVLDDPRA